MQKPDINKQLEIIKRGAVEIISEAELKVKLEDSIKNKRPLKVKAGFDPTVPDIHLGHTVLLRKLRQLQDLGHKVIFLIGDATALVGDPSGQSQTRKILTWDEVEKNAITYIKQVSKILRVDDPDVFERRHNSEWFSRRGFQEREFPPFTFEQFVELAQRCTVARLIERDDFQKRLKENKPLSFLELFYPLMQGYDSVKLESDIEVGGTDQKFNLLMGRDIQQAYGKPQQVIITMPLLEGTDGIQKMSKSYANFIAINENPNEMFGKIMSISDEMMLKYYTLLTDEDLEAVRKKHPKEAKLSLAENITRQYHGRDSAEKARGEFEGVFSKRGLPQDIPEYKTDGKQSIATILLNSRLVKSGNEARRLIKQGAVSLDNSKVRQENFVPIKGGVLKVGSRRFLKIIV
ncbi:MAG: tyrosine--tRNA ligase [Candidatus Omnitrophica bacterium CG23_combo_of_CG06-09_8_20_14_all_40_11]|nr:MAG: tyrosine--tRNA ligase [Candidatus Omnitrophica bacterium CG23_combo_of_CG06-09_8_20_14_all_40_11]